MHIFSHGTVHHSRNNSSLLGKKNQRSKIEHCYLPHPQNYCSYKYLSKANVDDC